MRPDFAKQKISALDLLKEKGLEWRVTALLRALKKGGSDVVAAERRLAEIEKELIVQDDKTITIGFMEPSIGEAESNRDAATA